MNFIMRLFTEYKNKRLFLYWIGLNISILYLLEILNQFLLQTKGFISIENASIHWKWIFFVWAYLVLLLIITTVISGIQKLFEARRCEINTFEE